MVEIVMLATLGQGEKHDLEPELALALVAAGYASPPTAAGSFHVDDSQVYVIRGSRETDAGEGQPSS